MLIEPILRPGEVVKRISITGVRAEEMGEFRVGVVLMSAHVICFHNDNEGTFRVYDNDSAERREGKPRRMRADEILEEMNDGPFNTIVGALQESSALSRRLGPPITTLFDRRQR